MTSAIVTYILIVLGGVATLLTAIEIIHNKKKKGIKSVTNIGWWVIGTIFIMTLLSALNLTLTNSEKETADRLLRKDLTDSFKIALNTFDSSLRYDAYSNKIINTINNYNQTGVVLNASPYANFNGNTFINQPEGYKPGLTALVPINKIINDADSIATAYKLTDRIMNILFVYNTDGFLYYNEIKDALKSKNYTIGSVQLTPDRSFRAGIEVGINNKKLFMVIGNLLSD
jgi:hypothetical protein